MPSGFWAKAPINRPQNTISPFILNFLSFKMSFFQRDSNSLIYVYRFSVFLKHLCNCSNLSIDEKRVLEGSKWYGLIVRKTVLNAIISHKTFAMIFHLRWKQVWWFFERMFKQLPSISISCETISCSIHPQLF